VSLQRVGCLTDYFVERKGDTNARRFDTTVT
jgi:hypothetical protein